MYELKTQYGTNFNVVIKKREYSNKRIALQAFDSKDGEPVATISVNLPSLICPKNHTWIKDYSENEGFMKQLIEQKVLSKPIMVHGLGFVTAHLCEVLI